MKNYNQFATENDELFAVEAGDSAKGGELFLVAAPDDLTARQMVADSTVFNYLSTRVVTLDEYARLLMLRCQNSVVAMGDMDENLIPE